MTKQDKIDIVRNNIVAGVQVYANNLAGKYYLYIFEDNYFEMYYGTDNFMHLTGFCIRKMKILINWKKRLGIK